MTIVAALPVRSIRPRLRRRSLARGAVTVLLAAPALLLVAVVLLGPMLGFLSQAVRTDAIRAALPQTAQALRGWDRQGLPLEAAFAAVAADLARLPDSEAAVLAQRLNATEVGFRSIILKTRDAVRAAGPNSSDPAADPAALVRGADRRWGQQAYWSVLETETRVVTPTFLLASVDLRIAPSGAVEPLPADRAIFRAILLRTLVISALVTVGCVLLGFPVAHALAHAPRGLASAMLLLVLLPFWTSALVRSAAWVVLLQREGLVNQFLLSWGLADQPLALVFNRTGVLIAMIHVQLPLFVLPMVGVIRRVPPELIRASSSLGASGLRTFLQVYLPQVMPGLVSGAILVFTVSLGYYVTPALVGGPGDQMLSWFIAVYTNQTVNWGMAGALGLLLVGCVGILLALSGRVRGGKGWSVR